MLRVLSAALVIATVALFAAPAGAATDPQRWGDTFCSETADWLTGAQQGAESLSTQAEDPSLTAAQGRQLIVQYISTGVEATKSFGQAVKGAGVPDVKHGSQIQAAILAGISGSGAALSALEKKAKAMPTKATVAFEKAASKIGTELGKFTQPFIKGLDKAESLDSSGELGNVLGTLPSCAKIEQIAQGG